jgi:hypothetical protein
MRMQKFNAGKRVNLLGTGAKVQELNGQATGIYGEMSKRSSLDDELFKGRHSSPRSPAVFVRWYHTRRSWKR